ncbi:MAG TPA: HAMP domain-containing sensor histidine kinase [Longimicrobiales bacterium]|nr:HAMP domain-containing sensor histidine kinase [Longimicrobiales bacterium]
MTGPVEEQAGQSSKELAESFPTHQREWLPIVALAAVLLVLLVLAATPALMLHRMSRTTERMTTLLLPAYEAVRDFAYVTERRLAAARSVALSDDPRYHLELAEGRAAEDSALRVMERHAAELGVRFSAHVDTLRQLVAQRDSLERALGAAAGPGSVVPLSRFDALNAETLRQVQHLRGALSDVTDITLNENARWAGRQRQVAVLLGIIAAAAALLLGWFGLQQQRLRHTAQHARALAERRRGELERMTESRERLLRGFTHDMKNPLGAASGYLQLLADGIMGRMTAEQKRSVDRASGSIMSALDLVDELLELARAESGHLSIRRMRTDLRTLVRDVAEEYRGQAECRGLAFDVALPAQVPPITTDRRRVGQVLGNLISNAVKYTQEGRILIRLDVVGDGDGSTDRAAISIEDTGPGIPREMQPRLFDEFVRVEPHDSGGAGIGLTIARRIAHALGGEITLHSIEGKGSVFTLWLPLDGEGPG